MKGTQKKRGERRTRRERERRA
uniref:Uncharacterized protein n=1 Tax=Anguilla anguilla TaxID=7936 RepID=A0A0E9V754_ANGAN